MQAESCHTDSPVPREDSGTIRLYCEKERLSGDQFEQLKAFIDIGDVLCACGSMKRTEKAKEKKAHAIFLKDMDNSVIDMVVCSSFRLRVEVENMAMESLQKVREGSKKATMQLVDIEYNTVDFFLKLLQL
ncbi:hypothetical protein Bca4012_029038 [Brassica carinata]